MKFFSRNSLPTIKDEAYVTNFDECKLFETHWIALYENGDNVIYFESFGVENIPGNIKKSIGNKNITITVYRIQAYNLLMGIYFCIVFIDFMLKCKIFSDCTNLFSPNEYEQNDKIILKYFQ